MTAGAALQKSAAGSHLSYVLGQAPLQGKPTIVDGRELKDDRSAAT